MGNYSTPRAPMAKSFSNPRPRRLLADGRPHRLRPPVLRSQTNPAAAQSSGSTRGSVWTWSSAHPQGLIYGKVPTRWRPGATRTYRFTVVLFARQAPAAQQNGSNTQADGSFVLGNLAAGRYFLSAAATTKCPNAPRLTKITYDVFQTQSIPRRPPVDINADRKCAPRNPSGKRRVFQIPRQGAETLTGGPRRSQLDVVSKTAPTRCSANGPQHGNVRGRDSIFEFTNVLPGTYVIRRRRRFPQAGASLTAERIGRRCECERARSERRGTSSSRSWRSRMWVAFASDGVDAARQRERHSPATDGRDFNPGRAQTPMTAVTVAPSSDRIGSRLRCA